MLDLYTIEKTPVDTRKCLANPTAKEAVTLCKLCVYSASFIKHTKVPSW